MTSYLDEYKTLHKVSPSFGSSAIGYLPELCLVIDFLQPKTVLDFGCGKASLIKALVHRYPNIEFYGYDPAIPGRDVLPIEKADLVINTDVLEHIPEEILPDVVQKIASISENCFFELHHALAFQILPNGENAHCTVKPLQWYYELLSKYFKNPYPLPGRGVWLSCMITFAPSVDFLIGYDKLISEDKDDKLSLLLNKNSIYWSYYKYKLLSKFSFGKKREHYKAKYNRFREKVRQIRKICKRGRS